MDAYPPPPYVTAEASPGSTELGPPHGSGRAIVFFNAVVSDPQKRTENYSTAHIFQQNGQLWHIHKRFGSLGPRQNHVQLAEVDKNMGFNALTNALVAATESEANRQVFSSGWKKTKVRVAGLRIIWEIFPNQVLGQWEAG